MRKMLKTSEQYLDEALEEWKALTELRHEISMDVYNAQDDTSKEILDRIRDRLRLAATGYISVRLPNKGLQSVKVEAEYVDMNLLFIATEILKDLALYGIQVGTYTYPTNICVSCGGNV